MLKVERHRRQEKQGGRENADIIENILDWLVKVEAAEGRPTTREAVLAELQAQALGGGAEMELATQRLEEEVASTRLVLRNILDLALKAGEADEYIHLVDLYGNGCSRLVRMLRGGQVDEEGLVNYIRGEIRRAIAEGSQDWV
jgi:hypothetical protein